MARCWISIADDMPALAQHWANIQSVYSVDWVYPIYTVSIVGNLRDREVGLRPPGLEFRILCLEDSVISIISTPSGGSLGPV